MTRQGTSRNTRAVRVLAAAVLAVIICLALGALQPGFTVILRTFSTFILNGLALGPLFFCAAHWLARRTWMPPEWVALCAGGAVAVAGYVSFWIWFAHPVAGLIFSTALIVLCAWRWIAHRPEFAACDGEWLCAAATMAISGFLHLGILHSQAAKHDFHQTATLRFVDVLSEDNRLPALLTSFLMKGDMPMEICEGGWLVSDRPPLQSGWQTLALPLVKILRLDFTAVTGTAGVWLQLLWVPAAFGLLRWAGLAAHRALGWCAVFALNGFFMLHTVYTWPKLCAGAFAIGAFGLWARPASQQRRAQILAGAALAALAWLSHGGVVFSLIALAPWLVWRALRGELREWTLAAALFAIFAMPWAAFQKFKAPPANRLLKWHLAGQVEIDPRGTWETIRDAYAKLTWDEFVTNRLTSFRQVITADPALLAEFSTQRAPERRLNEYLYPASALTWWLAAPLLALLALATKSGRSRLAATLPRAACLAMWAAASVVICCLLMFLPFSGFIIVGSFAGMVALFAFMTVIADSAGRRVPAVFALLQAASLTTTWLPANAAIKGPLSPPAILSLIFGAAGLAWLVLRSISPENAEEKSFIR